MNKATLGSHASTTKTAVHRTSHNGRKTQAHGLYNQASETANELFIEGKKAFTEAQHNIKEYSGELAVTVRKHPFAALAIAGGIGYIISSLFKR